MLIYDHRAIGNKLLLIRKKKGLSQAEVAEAAGVSDRTYADIERGTANMRLGTLLQICTALHITPDDVLTEEEPSPELQWQELFLRMEACTPEQKRTAMKLLAVYLDSLKE